MKNAKQLTRLIVGTSSLLTSLHFAYADSFYPATPTDFFSAIQDPAPLQRSVAVSDLKNLDAMTLSQFKTVAYSLPKAEATQLPPLPQAPKGSANGLPLVASQAQDGKRTDPSLTRPIILRSEQARLEDHKATLEEAKLMAELAEVPQASRPVQQLPRRVEFRISLKNGVLVTSQQSVEIAIGAELNVAVAPLDRRELKIFTRNNKIMEWDSESQKLRGVGAGRTEIYIAYLNHFQIVGVVVGNGELASDSLLSSSGQNFLQKLTDVIPSEAGVLSYQPSQPDPKAGEMPVEEEEQSHRKPLTLAGTAAEVDAVKELHAEQQSRFTYSEPPLMRRLATQVMDERSMPEKSLIYPVSGLSVRLVGTRVEAKTDARGHVLFGDLPNDARFWVITEDEKGLYVPTVSELSVPSDSRTEVTRVKTISYRSYFAYQSVLDVTQDSNLASFCARALDDRGSKVLAGLSVRINSEAEGPFYFGSFGPQRDLTGTDSSGRFCFFNVQPGLTEISFFEAGSYFTSVTLPLFAGAHTEEDFTLGGDSARSLLLAAMPTATEQVYEEPGADREPLQIVDMADVITVGSNESLSLVSPGVVGFDVGSSHRGRTYTLSQAPEFENLVVAIDESGRKLRHLNVLPLLPRGFTEDLYYELHQQDGHDTIPFDPSLGQALVFHKFEKEQGQVQVRLVDSLGRPVREGWYFGNTPELLKVAFFNLNPGLYQVLVESNQGELIAVDTLVVDFWTTAFVQTGGTLMYSLHSHRQASSN